MRVKEESEKAGIILNIRKNKIMASSPISSWQIDGKTVERVVDFIFGENSPEYSLEGLMLKLKLQYFGHLMQRNDSLENTLMLGKTEGRRG